MKERPTAIRAFRAAGVLAAFASACLAAPAADAPSADAETIRREIIKNFETWLKANGFIIVQKRDNNLTGKHGNTERFYWLKSV